MNIEQEKQLELLKQGTLFCLTNKGFDLFKVLWRHKVSDLSKTLRIVLLYT